MSDKKLLFNVKINSAGKTYCAPDWYWDTGKNQLKDFDLWMVSRGEGELKTPDRIYELAAGDCFILRYNQRYIGSHNQENPLVVIHVHFDFFDNEKKIKPENVKSESLPGLYRRLQDFNFVTGMLERVLTLYQENNLEADKWMELVLLEIIRQDRQDKYSGLELKQKSLIDKICSQINKNPGGYNSIDDMMEDISYSRDHFLRIFKKFTGKTPYDYLLDNKMETAKTLLLTSSHSISRIAEILGYNDLYHYSKQFKQKTGISPSAYRKKGREDHLID